MMSREIKDHWRRLTLGQRLKIVLQMMDDAVPSLLAGPPEQVARRFELLRRQNDERNRRMLEGIARSKRLQPPPG